MFISIKYKFIHWMFKWVTDEDGDVGIRIFGIITLIKYKEHTIIEWFKNFPEAGNRQGNNK